MLVLEDLRRRCHWMRGSRAAARADAFLSLAIGIAAALAKSNDAASPQGHQAGDVLVDALGNRPSHGLRDCVELPRDVSLPLSREIAGTFAYMAPEQNGPHEPVDRCSQRSLLLGVTF